MSTKQRALKFIAARQLKNGGFISYSSPSKTRFAEDIPYQTTFVPALILQSLSHVKTDDSLAIQKPLAMYLLNQKNIHGSYNYWDRENAEYKSMTYPDDLDDTFCALLGLLEHDPKIIDQNVLAQTVKLLVASESQVGGPYKTWLTADKKWQDVDLAVNANIACFINRVAKPLPKLNTYFEHHINTQDYTSPYYPDSFAITYYLARCYSGPELPKLVSYIKTLNPKNPMQRALKLIALTKCGQTSGTNKLYTRLTAEQSPDGSWPAAAYCLDPERQGKNYYHGSGALTTAFVLEALIGFETSKQSPKKEVTKTGLDDLHKKVTSLAKNSCQRFPKDLKKPLLIMIDHLTRSSSGPEITTLPHMFNKSLINPLKDKKLLDSLGLASLFGWVAYTIYDDFLDDEGDAKMLPAANWAMRRSLEYFRIALPNNSDFQNLVEKTFTTIDAANAWEVTHCRFTVTSNTIKIGKLPSFGNRRKLAERSMGHTLTPIAILLAQGHKLTDPAVKEAQKALEQYLIARQLNDDMHDWKDDIALGHITAVNTQILSGLKLSGPQKIPKLLPQMEREFWYKTLPELCKTTEKHIEVADKAIKDSSLLVEDNVITKLCQNLQKIVTETQTKQKDATNFLSTYRNEK